MNANNGKNRFIFKCGITFKFYLKENLKKCG